MEGIVACGIIFLALLTILGMTYISLSDETKSNFKEWVNDID